MFKNNVLALTLSTHFVNYAHNDLDIGILLNVYDNFFKKFRQIFEQKLFNKAYHGKPLKPLFQIR